MFKFATEIFDNPAALHETSKKSPSTLSSSIHILKMEKFMLPNNVNIDNTLDAIGIFKSELQADFIQI
jgi:hypothetical protein